MKTKVFLAILGMLGALITSEYKAYAVLISLNNGQSATFLYDGATASPVCTLCDGSLTLTFNGSSLNISFSNTSTDNLAGVNMLTLFAFNTTPDLTFSNPQFSGLPAGKTWDFQTNGLGGYEFGATSDQGINNGLDAGQSGSLSVTISSPLNLVSLAIDATQTHFQNINADGGSSTKPNGCVLGTEDCGGGPEGRGGAAATATAVPEPSTFLMLGSGLLVLARSVRKRRDLSID